jgi:haloacetate dehalogenase
MRTLGYDRFAVVGHDRRSYVAFRLAMEHPKLSRISWCSTAFPSVKRWLAVTPASRRRGGTGFSWATPRPMLNG